MVPEEALKILDAGRSFNGGAAPESIPPGGASVPNFRKEEPAQTILGAEQKAWFFDRLRNSKATWKIWGNTTATLDMRADPRNLPTGMAAKPWPGEEYAGFANGDHSNAYVEWREIYEFVRAHGITGFATIAGDRHSFWAGLAAESLPPDPFHPVGIVFVTGSISAPGMAEALEHKFPKEHPLRSLFLGEKSEPLMNLLLHRGVRACLKYGETGNIEAARALTNEQLSPHVSFVDMGGHGYSVVRVTSDAFETEFVCIPRPLERSTGEDGGPLRYRVTSRTPLWGKGERPAMETKVVEGDAPFSV
jgi:alkaline phosphatase D